MYIFKKKNHPEAPGELSCPSEQLVQSVAIKPAPLQVRLDEWVQEATLDTNCLPYENDVSGAGRQSLLKAFSQVLPLCHFLLDAHVGDAVSYV